MLLPPWLTPVLDAEEMGATDRWAIEERSIPSLELMEAAGAALAHGAGGIAEPGPVRVVCGKGNNGGDGLVAARHLASARYDVEALLLWPAEQLSDDARTNLDRFAGAVRRVEGNRLARALEGSGVVIDAIFGTGFEGAPRGPIDAAIEAINEARAPVCACDLPSGVDGSTGEVGGAAVKATLTVAFHAPKVGHLVTPGKLRCGELRIAEIGIPAGGPSASGHGAISPGVLVLAPGRGPESTKFSSGQVLVVGGSRGLTGAPCMVAQAASRAGAGYTTVAVPRSVEPIVEMKLTEQMTVGVAGRGGALGQSAADSIIEAGDGAGAIVLGPGLGRSLGAARLARDLVPRLKAPLVLDADGLNALAADPGILADRPGPTVLTPHAGELGRLLGVDSSQVNAHRLRSARELAASSGAIVLLKGDDTLVVDSDRVAVNELSAPGLATAGTGDVLAGLVAALIARGTEPFAAACAGVLAHARAGRRAAERLGGAEFVVASDVIEALPEGLRPAEEL